MYHWRKNLSQIRKNEQGAPMSGEAGEMRKRAGLARARLHLGNTKKKTFFFGISLDLYYLCSRLIKKVWILQKGF